MEAMGRLREHDKRKLLDWEPLSDERVSSAIEELPTNTALGGTTLLPVILNVWRPLLARLSQLSCATSKRL